MTKGVFWIVDNALLIVLFDKTKYKNVIYHTQLKMARAKEVKIITLQVWRKIYERV